MRLLVMLLGVFGAAVVSAADIGQVKTSQGAVQLERAGQKLPVTVGMAVRQSDVLSTGADGSVGLIFTDNTVLTAGPGSVLELSRFSFLEVGKPAVFDAHLRKGTLAVISGKIAKQSPDAMQVKTPSAILGVRGTEFLVQAEPGENK